MIVTRREVFSAAHRLHSPALTDEQNVALFEKCNWTGGHGHNYVVEVSVEGPVDECTGMVMNVSHLKKLIWERALSILDHRNIDRDVEWFKVGGKTSTAENVAMFIWEQVVEVIPAPAHLYKVKVYETENNYATYKGEK